jgi:outer membrane protein assembly factor BamB
MRWHFLPEEGTDHIRTYSTPTIFQDRVLIGMGLSGSKNAGKLYCLDINSGGMLWNFTTGDGGFGYGVATSPVVAYNKIIFGACDGKLYALDYDGNQLWNFTTGDTTDGIYSSPAVADNKVYFGSSDNVFYCLNVHNGSVLWKYDLSVDGPKGTYGVVSAPAIAYNRVLVGGNNGYLYCFGSLGTEPPTISIQKPSNNKLVKGVVEISGVADDDIEVTSVQIRIDDGDWINVTGKYTWTFNWDSKEVINGPHTIYARAFDKDGFVLTNITLIVNNGLDDMLVIVTSHKSGQIVSGTTKFEGTAYHSLNKLQAVQINIDNSTLWDTANGTSKWFLNWDTNEYLDGEYLIQFRAFDGENFSLPIGLFVNVSNYKEPILNFTPMFRSDRSRIGTYNSKVPNSSKELWNFTTENQIESSAVYYNGKIYFGSDDYFVYCLDSKSGTLIWKYETANQVRSSPVIAQGKLFIGSHDYYLYCLNAQSGELIWRKRTAGAIDSSPLVLNETVYFGSYDGKVYCLNISDKTEIWTFDTGDEIWGSPAYWDGCIYIGSLNGHMYCIWAQNGTERWNFSGNLIDQFHGIYSAPTIVDNKLIFGSEDKFVYCLDSSDGKVIWKFKTTGFVYSSAAVNNSKVFISSLESNNDGILYALPLNDPNLDTLIAPSEVLWKFRTHDFDGGSSPVVSTVSSMVLIGSNAGSAGGIGRLYCIDENTGTEIWNFTVNGDIHGTPLLANDLVYIGSLNEKMYCLGKLGDNGNGNGQGNGDDKNKTKIIVSIEISGTEVVAGHAIESIIFTATTANGTPIPQTWFTFEVTKGALSDYYGTAFDDGTYNVSFIAPNIKKQATITLTGTASRFGYSNGTASIIINVKPLPADENGEKEGEDKLEDEIWKPKYYMLWVLIIILIIATLLIFGLLVRTKGKLNRLEKGEEETKESDKKKIKKSEKQVKKQMKASTEERVPPPKSEQIANFTTPKQTPKTQAKNQQPPIKNTDSSSKLSKPAKPKTPNTPKTTTTPIKSSTGKPKM